MVLKSDDVTAVVSKFSQDTGDRSAGVFVILSSEKDYTSVDVGVEGASKPSDKSAGFNDLGVRFDPKQVARRLREVTTDDARPRAVVLSYQDYPTHSDFKHFVDFARRLKAGGCDVPVYGLGFIPNKGGLTQMFFRLNPAVSDRKVDKMLGECDGVCARFYSAYKALTKKAEENGFLETLITLRFFQAVGTDKRVNTAPVFAEAMKPIRDLYVDFLQKTFPAKDYRPLEVDADVSPSGLIDTSVFRAVASLDSHIVYVKDLFGDQRISKNEVDTLYPQFAQSYSEFFQLTQFNVSQACARNILLPSNIMEFVVPARAKAARLMGDAVRNLIDTELTQNEPARKRLVKKSGVQASTEAEEVAAAREYIINGMETIVKSDDLFWDSMFSKMREPDKSESRSEQYRQVVAATTQLLTPTLGQLLTPAINESDEKQHSQMLAQVCRGIVLESSSYLRGLISSDKVLPFMGPKLIKHFGMEGLRDEMILCSASLAGTYTNHQAELILEGKLDHPGLSYPQVVERLGMMPYDEKAAHVLGALTHSIVNSRLQSEPERAAAVEGLHTVIFDQRFWRGFNQEAQPNNDILEAVGRSPLATEEMPALLDRMVAASEGEERNGVAGELRTTINGGVQTLAMRYANLEEEELKPVQAAIRRPPEGGRERILDELVLMQMQGVNDADPKTKAGLILSRCMQPDLTYSEVAAQKERSFGALATAFFKAPRATVRKVVDDRRARREAEVARQKGREYWEGRKRPSPYPLLEAVSDETLAHERGVVEAETAVQRAKEEELRQEITHAQEDAPRREGYEQQARARGDLMSRLATLKDVTQVKQRASELQKQERTRQAEERQKLLDRIDGLATGGKIRTEKEDALAEEATDRAILAHIREKQAEASSRPQLPAESMVGKFRLGEREEGRGTFIPGMIGVVPREQLEAAKAASEERVKGITAAAEEGRTSFEAASKAEREAEIQTHTARLHTEAIARLETDYVAAHRGEKQAMTLNAKTKNSLAKLEAGGQQALAERDWKNIARAYGHRPRLPTAEYGRLMSALNEAGVNRSLEEIVIPDAVSRQTGAAGAASAAQAAAVSKKPPSAAKTATATGGVKNGQTQDNGGEDEVTYTPQCDAARSKIIMLLGSAAAIEEEQVLEQLHERDQTNSGVYSTEEKKRVATGRKVPKYLQRVVGDGANGIYCGILASLTGESGEGDFSGLRDRLTEVTDWFRTEAEIPRPVLPYLAALSVISRRLATSSELFEGASEQVQAIANDRLTVRGDRRLFDQLEEAYTTLVPGMQYVPRPIPEKPTPAPAPVEPAPAEAEAPAPQVTADQPAPAAEQAPPTPIEEPAAPAQLELPSGVKSGIEAIMASDPNQTEGALERAEEVMQASAAVSASEHEGAAQINRNVGGLLSAWDVKVSALRPSAEEADKISAAVEFAQEYGMPQIAAAVASTKGIFDKHEVLDLLDPASHAEELSSLLRKAPLYRQLEDEYLKLV